VIRTFGTPCTSRYYYWVTLKVYFQWQKKNVLLVGTEFLTFPNNRTFLLSFWEKNEKKEWYFSVLPCTSLYFLVLLRTSLYFSVLLRTSPYFSVLLYFWSQKSCFFPVGFYCSVRFHIAHTFWRTVESFFKESVRGSFRSFPNILHSFFLFFVSIRMILYYLYFSSFI